jgi:hypothetical protein
LVLSASIGAIRMARRAGRYDASVAGDSYRDEAQRLAEHQAKDGCRSGTERDADANLLGPLPDRIGHHTVDADRGERERDKREQAEQQ